jgi:hypothetical protein
VIEETTPVEVIEPTVEEETIAVVNMIELSNAN